MTPIACRLPMSLALCLCLAPAVRAAEQCFQHKNDTTNALMMLDLPDGDGDVLGVETGEINDVKEGYATSWDSTITGKRKGNQLDVKVEISIEGDKQVEKQTWRIEDGAVITDRNRYEPTDCQAAESGSFDNVPEHASEDISRGHCEAAEDVIFTCELDNNAVVSICAAPDRSTLAYRYGPPLMEPELTYPKDPVGSTERFMIHTIGYAGGYNTGLGFKTGAYTYVVNERMISRGPSVAEKDMDGGVTLYEGKKIKLEAHCLGLDETSKGLNDLMDTIKQVPFFDEDGLVE